MKNKFLGFVLVAGLFTLMATSLIGCVGYLRLRFDVGHADEQTKYFEEALQEARKSNSRDELSEWSAAVVRYYPTGTKQPKGSHLNTMVERMRRFVLAEIEEEIIRIDKSDEPD